MSSQTPLTALPQIHQRDLRGPTSKGMEGRERERREGRGEGVGAPFNFLPPGATDLVTPILSHLPHEMMSRVKWHKSLLHTDYKHFNVTFLFTGKAFDICVLQTLDVTKTLITSKSLKVSQNVLFTLETLSTKTTGKVSDV